jgi:hypothetical protein
VTREEVYCKNGKGIEYRDIHHGLSGPGCKAGQESFPGRAEDIHAARDPALETVRP